MIDKTKIRIIEEWFKENSWDKDFDKRAAGELLVSLEDKHEQAPYCHSEPMQKCERYLGGDGKIVIVYRCMFCHRKQEVCIV